MMEISERITWVEGQLTWPIKRQTASNIYQIISDPRKKVHTIYVPAINPREIEYLHELAHAVLAEKHHLLSTSYFKRGTSEEEMGKLAWILRAASDWYADYLLMKWVPEEEEKEIREHVAYVLSVPDMNNLVLYGGGLILAQAVFFLDERRDRFPSFFEKVIDIFINTPPGSPSVITKMNLVNELAALTTSLRVELVDEDGLDVWRIRSR